MSGRFWLVPRRETVPVPLADAYAPISAFESATMGVLTRTAPKNERAIVYAVAGVFATAILLMCVLPVERIAAGKGLVSPEGGSLYINPIEQVLVKQITVRPGDFVKKGQTLAIFDPTWAAADYQDAQKHVSNDTALIERLEAEKAGVPYVPKTVNADAALQLATYQQRQADYRQNLAQLDAKISAARAALRGSQDDVAKYTQRVSIASNLEGRYRSLQEKGFGAEIQTLSAQDTLTEDSRLLADAQSSEKENAQNLAAAVAARADYVAQWFATTETTLTTARTDMADQSQNFTKYQKTHDLTNLTAPEDGVVLSVAQASVGSVVSPSSAAPGAPALVTITPASGPLLAEVDIPSLDSSFVKAGQKVRIKLDAYKFTEYGTADGVVKSISSGSFTVDQNGTVTDPYFKVWVAITGLHLKNVPKNFHLVPGETLEGDIIVGHRTIMTYISDAVLRTGSEAMREP